MDAEGFVAKVTLAIIAREGRILLVHRKLPMFRVEWAFPSGVMKQGETEEEAVVREMKERLDIDVKVVKKILERKHPDTLVQIVYFHCDQIGENEPDIKRPDKYSEFEWVPAGEVLGRFTSDVHPDIEKFVKSFAK